MSVNKLSSRKKQVKHVVVYSRRGAGRKITRKQAMAIRDDPRTAIEIAKDYPLSARYINQIKRGDAWGTQGKYAPELCTVKGCEAKHLARGFCEKHYRKLKKWGDATHSTGRAEIGEGRAFIEKAAVSNTDECILWPFGTGYYGRVQIKKGAKRAIALAHRLALELSGNAPPSPSHLACHAPVICHDPSCINPRHLRWASHAENACDMKLDGTVAPGFACTKLTKAQVRAIRSSKDSVTNMSRYYGISCSAIYSILNRKTWKHLA